MAAGLLRRVAPRNDLPLSRSAGFLTLRARRLGENPGFRSGQLARGSLSAVPVQELAVCPGAVQPLLRGLLELLLLFLRQLFPGLGRQFFGFLQGLLLRRSEERRVGKE